jgi:predicted thioredoxin/glutaredoxin
MSIEIKIFGSEPPCATCKRMEQAARAAAVRFPGRVTVTKVAARSVEGQALALTATPAVVVDGRLVAQGEPLGEADFERIIETELGG